MDGGGGNRTRSAARRFSWEGGVATVLCSDERTLAHASQEYHGVGSRSRPSPRRLLDESAALVADRAGEDLPASGMRVLREGGHHRAAPV
jgi:hypothetical protein